MNASWVEIVTLLLLLLLPVAIVVFLVRAVAGRKKSTSLTERRPAHLDHANTADAIERLHALKQKGALTEEEFTVEKKRILASTEPTAQRPG